MEKRSLKNKKVLITSGPCWVAIDQVRVISNQSSGEMGQCLAEAFVRKGSKVTVLEGPVRFGVKNPKISKESYLFFDELAQKLKTLAKQNDIIVHAAAVADYRLKKSFSGKISSSSKKLTLQLFPTPKIINTIKKNNPKAVLVGFKLEPHLTPQKAFKESEALFNKALCDVVVANSLNGKEYKSFLVTPSKVLAVLDSKQTTANRLVQYLEEIL